MQLLIKCYIMIVNIVILVLIYVLAFLIGGVKWLLIRVWNLKEPKKV